jgi:glutamate racemase
MSWIIPKKQKSIGVFDSGIGGLTVVRSLMTRFPGENIVYFGDTARVPYGIKSASVVRQYAIENTQFLVQQGVKMIVVACNTVSAVAIDDLRAQFAVPIVGMIETGAAVAADISTSGRVGVIGTLATIASNSYTTALLERRPAWTVIPKACPLFVSLAEEGWGKHHVTRLVAEEYLAFYRNENIDTLILGCTHYPILRDVIQATVGENVTLVDSGEAASVEVGRILEERDLVNDSTDKPNYVFYVSDVPQRFKELGEIFLGQTLPRVGKVHLH